MSFLFFSRPELEEARQCVAVASLVQAGLALGTSDDYFKTMPYPFVAFGNAAFAGMAQGIAGRNGLKPVVAATLVGVATEYGSSYISSFFGINRSTAYAVSAATVAMLAAVGPELIAGAVRTAARFIR